MSSLDRLRGRSPPARRSPPKSPTSSPRVIPPDPTITSTLPYLRTIYNAPGTHNTASFLRELFTQYLRLHHDITHAESDEETNTEDQVTLQKLKDMINLTKTIRGIPGHESARMHIIDTDVQNGRVTKYWVIRIPTYRLAGETDGQRPTLDLANIRLLDDKEDCAADVLPTEDYERMLLILVSHIIRILGSDSVPVVIRPVTTDVLRRYIEPLTRMGKYDALEFPAVEGEMRPRFRLLGISNREVRRRNWVREGEFGWSNIADEEQVKGNTTAETV